MKRSKKLLLMNGRWYEDGKNKSIYLAANSKEDAIRMLTEFSGYDKGWRYEIDTYFSKGVWGDSMEGIEPERGIWIQDEYGQKPRRVH